MKTATRFGALALLAAFALRAEGVRAQPSADPAAQADEHFRAGKTLLRAGRKQEALAEYHAALALKKTYDIAGNCGSVELDLGLPRDAAEHLSFAIRNYAPSGTTAEQLDKAKQRFAMARAQVGAATLSTNVTGAEVVVDGKVVGRAPLADDLYLDPGSHEIEVRSVGYESARRTVVTTKGSSATVALDLVASTVAPAPGPPPSGSGGTSPIAPVHERPSPAMLIVGGAATVVGIGLGTALTILANSKASSADKLAAQLRQQGGAKACLTPSNSCTELHSDRSSAAKLGNVAFWSFIGAGVAGGATVIYWAATPSRTAAAADRAGVRPVVGIGLDGVTIRGSW